MIPRKDWHIKDKWRRHLALLKDRTVAAHLPATGLLAPDTLKSYLKRYRAVFVKPVYGSFGNRIMKLQHKGQGYTVQQENEIRRIGAAEAPRVVSRFTRSRKFLIQQGVSLLKLKGKPIDFRVLVLKPGDSWKVMGIMGKVAGGNRIVTNYQHGGQPIWFSKALDQAGYPPGEIRELNRHMRRLGLQAAEAFGRSYPHCRRIGVDVALDRRKRMWILEVNTNPYYELFRHHRRKNLYARIDRLMKHIRKNQAER